VRPVDPTREKTILENFTDEDNATYILHVLTRGDGQPGLSRQLWFDRLRLQLVRQLIFDGSGDIVTDARYSSWQVYDNVAFPKSIELERPKDEYGVVMNIVKMDINKPVTDDKFQLDQPDGTELKVLGAAPENAKPASAPPASKKGKKKK